MSYRKAILKKNFAPFPVRTLTWLKMRMGWQNAAARNQTTPASVPGRSPTITWSLRRQSLPTCHESISQCKRMAFHKSLENIDLKEMGGANATD
jgi:hypothetical protein